LCGGRFGRGAS
jgi:hypothetical protein